MNIFVGLMTATSIPVEVTPWNSAIGGVIEASWNSLLALERASVAAAGPVFLEGYTIVSTDVPAPRFV